MNYTEAINIIREILGIDELDPTPPTISRFLEASKTVPSGLHRPYISIAKYWLVSPPRGGIVEAEMVKWGNTLETQISALESLQIIEDNNLPGSEIIPDGWGVGLADLPVFSAIII